MMIQSTTNNHLSIINNHLAFGISTTVERALQIHPFMQNKANFPDDQMNVNKVLTMDYENKSNCKLCENKANTNPIQTQSKPIKANIKPKQTQYKANQSRSEAEIPTGELLGILKPGTNFKGKKMLLSTFLLWYI